ATAELDTRKRQAAKDGVVLGSRSKPRSEADFLALILEQSRRQATALEQLASSVSRVVDHLAGPVFGPSDGGSLEQETIVQTPKKTRGKQQSHALLKSLALAATNAPVPRTLRARRATLWSTSEDEGLNAGAEINRVAGLVKSHRKRMRTPSGGGSSARRKRVSRNRLSSSSSSDMSADPASDGLGGDVTDEVDGSESVPTVSSVETGSE
ncbi:hypothetical protein M433DRAFT_8892, partial [Acidomyces richmondensis BFW]